LDAGARWDPQHPAEIEAFTSICKCGFTFAKTFATDSDEDEEEDDIEETYAPTDAYKGDPIQLMELLIAAKADVNPKPLYRGAPLIAAAARPKALRVLLNAGADVDIRGVNGETALCTASFEGAHDSVKLLLDAKADIDAMDFRNATALKHAVEKGDIDIVRLLVAAGADVEVGYSPNTSSLSKALDLDDPDMVRVLLDSKADVRKLSVDDMKRLEEAMTQNSGMIPKHLLHADLDLSQ